MNTILKNRVETVFCNLRETYQVVPDEIASATINKLWNELKLTPRETTIRTINGTDLSPQEIKSFLTSLLIEPEIVTTLIWPYDRCGIYLPFHLFIEYYDDLWYPASDDVWIMDPNISWLLEIDHEENFSFFQF